MNNKRASIPGFTIALILTLLQLCAVIVIPLTLFLIDGAHMGSDKFFSTILDKRVLNSFYISFLCATIAMIINAIFGLILAWVLVRYDFLGKRFVDGLIDLPFALPTAVAGIALTSLYTQTGWVGQYLYAWGIESAFSFVGITIALVFVGIPFVARSVEPVLQELNHEYEEAARMLGASPFRIFRSIIFPELKASLLIGASLAFARGIGEYGSVVFISGNLPFKTEIAPLMIMSKMEQYDYDGAIAISLVLMTISFSIMLGINIYQKKLSTTRGV